MALMFAASDSMPSFTPVLRTLSDDGTSCESGIIWIFMVSSFPLARPPQRGLDGGKNRWARRGSRVFAGTRNATKSAAGNFVCVMGGRSLETMYGAHGCKTATNRGPWWRMGKGQKGFGAEGF
jgi:hypothetical protein